MAERAIGLREPAEHVYRTMLRRPRWRVANLSKALTMSEAKVRELVEELRGEGLIALSADDGEAVRAVEPCLALPALATRRMRGAVDGNELPGAVAVARFVSLHERAAERPSQPDRGLDEVAALVERMAATVRNEMVMLVPHCAPGAFEFAPHIAEAVLRQGAALRQVWSSSILDRPIAIDHARWLGERGTVPHAVPHVPNRIVIMDSIIAVVLGEQGNARVVPMGAPGFTSIVQLAERLWERSVPVRHASRPGRIEMSSPRHEQVLRLLAEGLTDEAIARRIGVSVRTVRNEVASAMTGLDARSRFQAGVRAAQMGLI
jgi:DNA-binding CsgD family transcriptional regulator